MHGKKGSSKKIGKKGTEGKKQFFLLVDYFDISVTSVNNLLTCVYVYSKLFLLCSI